MQKPKVKIQIFIFLEFWVVSEVSSFVGNSVYNIALCILNRYINSGLHGIAREELCLNSVELRKIAQH